MIRKIALGTAQFGLDYGINNLRGKIPFTEAKNILAYAHNSGIRILDTAFAYGDSESVIGSIMSENNMSFKIVSKSPKDILPEKVYSYFYESLKRLNKEKIYGYLVHAFQTVKKYPEIWKNFCELRKDKKVKKIGFSLYYPSEIDFLLKNNIKFDIVQIPYSIFDQRFESYFQILKQHNVEIHVRSVFLQGLFFKNPKKIDFQFKSIKEKLILLTKLAKDNDTSVASICLNFVHENEYIDKVIIGVDSLNNLKDNLSSINKRNYTNRYFDILKKMKVDDENIIIPSNWNL